MTSKHPTWYAFVRWLVRAAYFNTHGGFRTVNQENMPEKGGILVAPVHISHLDPPAIACGSKRRLRFMAKEELFANKLFSILISSLGAFPVKRGETDTESIRMTIQFLSEGEAVLIFPEGTRGDGESIQEMSRGVAMLAKRTQVPVVPVGIIGTNIIMPRGKSRGQKHVTTIAIGKPFTYAEVATSSSEKENRELFANELQTRILELCRENGLSLKIPSKH